MSRHPDEWGALCLAERALPDGRYAVVYRLTFGRARLAVMQARGAVVFENEW